MLKADGYYMLSENGTARLALIQGVLTGTYIVAPFGGRGFMSLGVQLDATDFKLSLIEAGTWKRTVLGQVPFHLPFRQLMPRGHEDEATYQEWVEFPVPGQGLLTWCADDYRHRRCEGTYVVGWPGVHRTAAGDQAVFIKVIKEPDGLAYILENERHLRRAAGRNPALTAFAPLAATVWTQGAGAIASRIPHRRPGCAVVLERLIKGPTLAGPRQRPRPARTRRSGTPPFPPGRRLRTAGGPGPLRAQPPCAPRRSPARAGCDQARQPHVPGHRRQCLR